MKRIFNKLLLLATVSTVVFLYSCGEDDVETPFEPDPNSEFDARFNTADPDSLSAKVFLTDVKDNKVDVFLTFSSDNEKMRRIYATENIQDKGDEAFELKGLTGAEGKADGSLELDGDQGSGFTLNLDIPTTDFPAEGTVVYTFWTTTGRGDYRDAEKRQATKPMVLTIDLSGTNPEKVLVETTGVKLLAPTADGKSATFTSNSDCKTYIINDGEELAAFWDFGYYYGVSNNASLASTEDYPELFEDPQDATNRVSVNVFLGIDETEVNKCYFVKAGAGSSITYANVTTVDDLKSSPVDTSSPQVLNKLEVGDEIFILDQYGKRGIIKVTKIEGTFNQNDFIQYDIKIEK